MANSSTVTNTSHNDEMFPPLQVPNPIIKKRNRTSLMAVKETSNSELTGTIKYFCRSKGHGYITPSDGSEDVFLHISDIEGEYVPLPADVVKYRLCPIPPKCTKHQAINVEIINITPQPHVKWNIPKAN